MSRCDQRRIEVAKKFVENTANHVVTGIEEHGTFRRVCIENPASFAYHYELVTWPGYLAITGDCGTYIFSRLPDMFEFFRSKDGTINPGYWSEKVVAADPRIPIEEFDMETLRQSVRDSETVDDPDDESAKPKRVLAGRGRKMLAALDEVPAGFDSEMETAAVEALHDFDQDAHELGRTVYTFGFLWLLHAIVQGIQKYDAAKLEAAQ